MSEHSPVTGPYHGPSLADQLRLMCALIGTQDPEGIQDLRNVAAYVRETCAEMVAALRAVETGSARAMGEDSTGQKYCHLLMASKERVQAALAKADGIGR